MLALLACFFAGRVLRGTRQQQQGDVDIVQSDVKEYVSASASACSMLLVAENNYLFQVYVSGDNDDSSDDDVTFGRVIAPELEYPRKRILNFLASIDPQSGAIAYVYTFNTTKDDEIIDDYDDNISLSLGRTSSISILYYYQGNGKETSRIIKRAEIPMPVFYVTMVASIHVFDTAVYVGTGGTVGWVNFGSSSSSSTPYDPPKYQELIRRRTSYYKAYDMFAREGNFLVAVDDMIDPIYADSFQLHGSQHVPVHKRDFTLPYEEANLKYKRTALIGDFLILLGNYYACYGNCYGQLLYRFDTKSKNRHFETIRDHEVSRDLDIQLYQNYSETSINFNPDGDLDWVDLAVTSRGEVAIAALDRGLCVIPPGPFKSAEPFYQTVDLGGRVRAVNTCGSATWALVENNNNNIIKYHFVKLDSSWSELTKVAIPNHISLGFSKNKESTVFLAG